jgi:uncharacterized protein YjbJ (UPF0337 family)
MAGDPGGLVLAAQSGSPKGGDHVVLADRTAEGLSARPDVVVAVAERIEIDRCGGGLVDRYCPPNPISIFSYGNDLRRLPNSIDLLTPSGFPLRIGAGAHQRPARHQQRAIVMNWDQIKGKWHEVKGSIRAKWGELTDDEIEELDGNREKMVGKIQQKYGVAKEEAEKQVDEWTKSHG